ncbi:rRNA adenine N-6-methyltransferase family protein [Caviibacter abscessus]|uniref:rRNA adenine N-6-methyltransferase family protein n=1 Tax=Caviibacter abscessus TaxID=1766719 RepID=UPI000830CED2|nr:rRNA adenine N-6-methyltransferase family protein [Caviibacter abscessus]
MKFEKIDDYNIKIYDDSFKITKDAILLTEYILNDKIENKRLLEIGPGTGYISIKLSKYIQDIVAVEIQNIVYERLLDNVNSNNINIKVINKDIKDFNGEFDYIVSNPPYYKLGSGKYPDNNIKKYSKFEFFLNLETLLQSISRLLKLKGYFYLIYPISRKEELIKSIEKFCFKIINIETVDDFVLVKGQK